MRVVSYNLHKGESFYRRRWVLDRIRDAMRTVQADVVVLQEVRGAGGLPEGSNGKVEAQFEFLAEQIWPHVAYGRNAVYSSGHHGNAILSKHRLVSCNNLDISHAAFEPRGLLHAVIEVPGHAKGLHVVCVHLGLDGKERENQLTQLMDHLRTEVDPDAPLLVAGDFNDWRERMSAVLRDTLGLREVFAQLHGKHARTFPSWFPLLKLDRIYHRGLHVADAGVLRGRPWRLLSDHVAIYADVMELDVVASVGRKRSPKPVAVG